MTYDVFGGTLSLTQSINVSYVFFFTFFTLQESDIITTTTTTTTTTAATENILHSECKYCY